jgi:peptide-methionine (S)-S-oxide reductase
MDLLFIGAGAILSAMSLFKSSAEKYALPTADTALPGRQEAMRVPAAHFVNGNPLQPPFPAGLRRALFGMGCFWGVERKFWQVEGVFSTAAGYAAGLTPNPSYQEVCSGRTGHNEVVLVVYDPAAVSYGTLLKLFWEGHDPTQGMRQGNDRGTQYRSGIYVFDEEQRAQAEASEVAFGQALERAGHGAITTEILSAPVFYYAEDYHQQYLAKNPGGYCGLGGTGVTCPEGSAGLAQ